MAIAAPTFSKAVHNLSVSVLTLTIIGVLSLAVIQLQGHKLLSVQTASMLPTIRPGDALIVKPSRPSQLRPGEVISYHNPRHPNIIISHRLVSIDPKTGWLTTVGDALHSPDPSFPPYLLVGQATAIAPRLGLVIDSLHRPIGLILTVYLPAMSITAAEINHLARAYARPSYSVRL